MSRIIYYGPRKNLVSSYFHSAYMARLKEKLDAYWATDKLERYQDIYNGNTKFYSKYDLTQAIKVTTFNSTGVNAAIVSAFNLSTFPKLVVCDQNVTTNGAITMRPGVDLIFTNGATVTNSAGTGLLNMTHNSNLVCPELNGLRITYIGYGPDDGNITNVGVANAKIIGGRLYGIAPGNPAILDNGFANSGSNGSVFTNCDVLAVDIEGADYGIRMSKAVNCKYHFCRIDNISKSGARGIEFRGGTGNVITMNLIRNSRTGVNWLCDRTQTIGFENNYIAFNFFYNISEEATSVDANCNSTSTAIQAVVDRVVLYQTSGTYNNNPKLIVIRHNLAGVSSIDIPNIADIAVGMHAVCILGNSGSFKSFKITAFATTATTVPSGVNAGKACIELTLENNSIDAATLSSLNTEAANGSGAVTFSIQWIAKKNIINSNYYDMCLSPISLFGAALNNIVCNNIIRRTLTDGDTFASIEQRTIAGFNMPSNGVATQPVSGGGNPSAFGVAANNEIFNNDVDALIYCQGRSYNSITNLTTLISKMPLIGGENSSLIVNEIWKGNPITVGANSLSGQITDSGILTNMDDVPILSKYGNSWLNLHDI